MYVLRGGRFDTIGDPQDVCQRVCRQLPIADSGLGRYQRLRLPDNNR